MNYSEKKMEGVRKRVQDLIQIVNELECDFPGRHFTLDGHLVGSIGEVMAAYHYGIELYRSGEPIHDGEIEGKKVQIKITQRGGIVLQHEPDNLLGLYLKKDGRVFEVYNGPGRGPFESTKHFDSYNNKHIGLGALMKLDGQVPNDLRIPTLPNRQIEKMRIEYKNCFSWAIYIRKFQDS